MINVPVAYSTPAGGSTARERAELYAEARQEREDETGELLAKRKERLEEKGKKHEEQHGETCAQYFGRFIAHRATAGRVRRVRDLRCAWEVWMAPRIGRKAIAGLTRDDVEDVRDALDAVPTRENRPKFAERAGFEPAAGF